MGSPSLEPTPGGLIPLAYWPRDEGLSHLIVRMIAIWAIVHGGGDVVSSVAAAYRRYQEIIGADRGIVAGPFDVWDAMGKLFGEWRARFQSGYIAARLVGGILLLCGGITALRTRPTGRRLFKFACVVGLAWAGLGKAWHLSLIWPLLRSPSQPSGFWGSFVISNAGELIGTCATFLLVIWLLTRPAIKQAFERR